MFCGARTKHSRRASTAGISVVSMPMYVVRGTWYVYVYISALYLAVASTSQPIQVTIGRGGRLTGNRRYFFHSSAQECNNKPGRLSCPTACCLLPASLQRTTVTTNTDIVSFRRQVLIPKKPVLRRAPDPWWPENKEVTSYRKLLYSFGDFP